MNWRWATAAAAAIYCLWSGLLIAQRPGLYYDEALLVAGAVHMRHSAAEFDQHHTPHTWECKFHHCLPLMAGGLYIGAVKEYLCVPLFALFGPRTSVIRLVSVLLALIGIWGMAKLAGEQVGAGAGAAVALILAMNPAFIDQTVFDNGAVAIVMAGLGLVCAAFSWYLNKCSTAAAFWLGVAMGYGIWARANFIWTLIAMGVAAALVFGKRILIPVRHWITIGIGGVLGGAPFLAFQFASRGGTWRALDMFTAKASGAKLFYERLYQLAETLLSDEEHRDMWGSTFLPSWQLWLFPLLVAAACALPWLVPAGNDRTRRAARFTGLSFLILVATMFLSRLSVTEHHFILAVPLAAAAVVLSCAMFANHRPVRVLGGALTLVYAGCAIFWNAAAIRGLHQTGGVGPWSDAGFELAREVRQMNPAEDIKIIDWGLQFNLYVMLDGKPHSQEIYDSTSDQVTVRNVSWKDEVRKGGVFLLNGPEDRQFPAPSQGFLRALAEVSPVTRRHTVVQRNGSIYAQFIEVDPGSHEDRGALPLDVELRMKDPGVESHLDGFYPVENGQWRWTRRIFAVTFDGSRPQGEGAQLTLQIYIPDASIQRLGAMTLKAQLGGHPISSATYQAGGIYTFQSPLRSEWIHPGPMRIDFALDKALPATAPDNRELGIVVEDFSVKER